jgi:hypothetical protein
MEVGVGVKKVDVEKKAGMRMWVEMKVECDEMGEWEVGVVLSRFPSRHL